MRKTLFALLLFVWVAFTGCSTDVDLYADYKQVPVIYGLLDARADTNYIKITRCFYAPGDAFQTALNPDSSNYPGKLDVRLVEYRNGDSIREIVLDTITLHDKEPGTFYAPHQKLYYTAERLKTNTTSYKFSYTLKIVFPDRTLVTKAKMVGNSSFGIQSQGVNFSQQYIGLPARPFLFRPAINAKFYDVYMTFTFKEQRAPGADSVPRTMKWKIGRWLDDELAANAEGDCYAFKYFPGSFYSELASFIGGDTAVPGLKRYIGDYPIEVVITAGGDKLWHYVYTNSVVDDMFSGGTNFSLMDDAYGVFSSRATARGKARLAGETVPELTSKTNWGFVFTGGKDETVE